MPEMALKFESDLVRNGKGEVSGTFAEPGSALRAFPLSSVTVEGRTIQFVMKGSGGVNTFKGVVSEDGSSIAGEVTQNGESAPFALTRTGEARVIAAPRNPAISAAFEGTWRGTLDAGGRKMRLVLALANEANGTSSGSIVSPDGSGVPISVGITQNASTLTIEVAGVGGRFVGAINDTGTELVGTWTQNGASLPLTLVRADRP